MKLFDTDSLMESMKDNQDLDLKFKKNLLDVLNDISYYLSVLVHEDGYEYHNDL